MSSIIDQYRITKEPYYRAVADEVELYEAAYSVRMPMMLKGPTGCGKTRFVEYMAYKLDKPLITVACNEDMTASDLVGRFLLSAQGSPSPHVMARSATWTKWWKRARTPPW
jgi:nitric oxide reductase NorQ protein